MDSSLKVLNVALQKGNYNLAAHALVYGMVKASIAVREKHASPAAIPASGIACPASIKTIPPSHNTNAALEFIPGSSHQLTSALSSDIPAKTGSHISANPSLSGGKIQNGEEKE